ncbi:LysM peptidoglycan-binding domain-containing protein [Waltera acetigignens]|uniref:LysM peptidoglycan-binding domain-containing protein n=1 Tax=Waltera acetigignens TaxID=2981769 RepID=UPI0021D23A18|nr:LysM peptidoglycan-binding domain-containing protein [Brotolimicola acetigignens]MCU6759282.1 LysM peptidoglycan-binding domain-containing protein [Brotolimicola acetigignens]
MSRCKRKRFLAFMLTVAMLLGVMPVDLLGGIASVKAAETVHEVNFTKLPVEGKKDTDPFTNDMMADSYYALVGSAMCRLNSEATKVKAVELSNKEGKSAINFTVSGTATLEVKFSSTGGGKTSKLALKKDGTQIADSVKEATGTTGETVTYSNLATGTYSIISAEGFTERSVRIISIKVTETSQDVPAGATVSGNIAVVDNTNGLVQEGQKVSLTAAENKDTVELAVGVENEDITLSAGTKYNIVAPNENVRAVAEDGKTTITTGTEAFSTTITLGKAKVEALVKLAEGSELENGATLTLINTADAGDTVQLTPNGTVPLKVGATYEISTSMALADAKVNGEKTVTVTEETTELIISIESTQVATTITVKDADGLLGDGAVTLTNMKDTADVHSFKSGEAVSLTIGEVYKVSCAVNNAIIKINNSTIYKASRETTNANVVISAKDADLHELDLSGGLLKGQTYEGGISVLADMPYTSNTLEACGVLYEGTVQTPKENPSPNNGAIPTTGAAVKLVAEKAGKLKVTVSLVSKVYYFLEETANGPKEVLKFDNTTNTQTGGKVLILPVEAGKTYYLYTHGSKIKMYGITVDYRTSLDWNKIETPVLGTPSVKGGTISVPYTAQVGGIYAETLDVTMYDANGKAVNKQSITAEGESGVAEFTPAASGTYSFKAELIRTGEASKVSNTTTSVNFVLPMATPAGLNAENKGHGNVKLTWQAVPEAENYTVYVDGKVYAEGVTKLLQKISGLTVGQEYTFGVAAVRGNDISKPAEVKLTITEDAVKTWNYSAFGSSVDTMSEGGKNNGFSGSYDTQDLKVWSMNSKGKLVPNSTDGVAFYYTTIDPETENFTLSADVTVDSWKFTNGQEGFGLMVADRVGENGSGNSFWNNSYMVSATKVEYFWDAEAGQVSDAGDKYTMKLGVGSQEKIGVTPENLAADTVVDDFQTAMRTLETSAVASGQGAGTYNMVGGYEAALKDITDVNPQTTFHMTIQRNNTGYFLSYTNAATGETVTNKYYHGDNGDELTRLDENNIYVGFYASRSAKVSFSNMSLTTVAPENDAPAEARPITYVTPNFSIESAKVANNANYEMVYYGNADGVLSITNSKGEAVVSGQHVDAKTKFRVNTVLEQGSNTFAVEFTPDADYKPAKYSLLSSYDTVKFDFNVTYNVKDRSYIYVSPDGRSYGSGAKDDPVDIYTAVKSAAPGRTILLKGGTYALDKTVIVERGVNGTADAKIYMIADPEAATRPVLDFQGRCAGMILAGNYWYFQGFDVTRSANAQKGIQVSGSYNTVDNVVTYKNGNTGLQISRYKSTDNWEDWPSHNLILNCTSYLNADAGYEDADGFAAKLTVADGNVFDGCIAAYNADDGWDLFAKVETGAIGQVTIQNSVAFKNGYVLDENGQEVDAGNGNGFKMGGSSISGQHILRNSVSFSNKAKGIDSNSCPDIEAYSSTSYNNESFNVAFYTNDAKNTAFIAKGILSFKDSSNAAGQTVAEQFKPKGTQETSAYENAMNYYWRGENSTNSEGIAATAEWFQNMDMNSAIHGGIRRNTDGTINMNGFLAVTSAVPAGVGARMTGTPSAVFTVAADVVNNDDDDDDDNNSGSSAAPAVDWTDVSNSVQDKVAEMMKNPAIASVNMNFVCSGEVKVPQNVLNTIKGTKLTVAFHSGNGVALSISGQDLKNKDLSKIQNIDLTVDQTSNTIPANVVSAKSGTVNRQLGIRDTGSFGVNVNIHVNVGKDNSGKSANLYRYNTEKGRLEYCGSFTVTSTGQSMFALKRGGNYLVTVTDRRPSESIWYTEGGYTVKSGDTLSRIAKRNHMTLAQLLRRNVQITNQNVIRVGQKLNLD